MGFDPKTDMPVKYMKPGMKLRVHSNNVKKTWVLMFNDHVILESSDAGEIIDLFDSIIDKPAGIVIYGNEERGKAAAKEIASTLGDLWVSEICGDRKTRVNYLQVYSREKCMKVMMKLTNKISLNYPDLNFDFSFWVDGPIILD